MGAIPCMAAGKASPASRRHRCRGHDMATRIEVKGLSQAKDNFQNLSGLVQKEIGRESLREAGWMLARPMRAATYTTFLRRTGAIRSGLGVAIQRDAKSDKLTGYV